MFPSLLLSSHGSEDSSHISQFHQLKHDPAVSRSRLAAHLQHNYPGSYVHSNQNQFCCANVEEEVSPFMIYSRDKPTLFLSPNPGPTVPVPAEASHQKGSRRRAAQRVFLWLMWIRLWPLLLPVGHICMSQQNEHSECSSNERLLPPADWGRRAV